MSYFAVLKNPFKKSQLRIQKRMTAEI